MPVIADNAFGYFEIIYKTDDARHIMRVHIGPYDPTTKAWVTPSVPLSETYVSDTVAAFIDLAHPAWASGTTFEEIKIWRVQAYPTPDILDQNYTPVAPAHAPSGSQRASAYSCWSFEDDVSHHHTRYSFYDANAGLEMPQEFSFQDLSGANAAFATYIVSNPNIWTRGGYAANVMTTVRTGINRRHRRKYGLTASP